MGMAKLVDAVMRLVGCEESDSEDVEATEEDFSESKKQPCLRKGSQRSSSVASGETARSYSLGLWLCGAAVVAITIGVVVWIPKLSDATRPTWEVKELLMERIDIPALAIKGVAPADTSACPTSDLCGVASARGCSKCPDASMWNNGCLCQEKDPGSNASAQPGSVVKADVSACPLYDKCGVLAARGCSKCPDDSWTNDGCSCRQAISVDQFFHALGSVAHGIEGTMASAMGLVGGQATVVGMRLRATVEVNNPNPVGATTDAGVFKIRYRGLEIGSADTDPVVVEPRGSSTIVANVEVDNVPADVGMMMLQEILQTGSQLSLVVDGSVTAKVKVLEVKCTTECRLRTDVSKLPKVKFTENHCSYGYSV